MRRVPENLYLHIEKEHFKQKKVMQQRRETAYRVTYIHTYIATQVHIVHIQIPYQSEPEQLLTMHILS